ncbi:hypothetical protein [Oceanobacillus salinisoli]|uniref:hypothetical protein n=1 Tax=Oceanobacillus salinisoli TaxID=2678611 RepID=UPI0012E2A0A5|nr:hypothetical protein [Oceanobacillus salinisoli]
MLFLRLVLIAAITLTSSVPVTGISKEQEAVIIDTYQADVTGDGILDDINLKGIPFAKDADYFHNIWAEIKSKSQDDGRWKINYGDGYEPTIQFVDVNHDKVQDMLFQSPTGGGGGLYHYDLHTIADNELAEIPLPKLKYVSGEFTNQFIAEIRISPNEKPIEMDISNRAEEYISLEIYNKEGKLSKSRSLMIDPIAFYEPVKLTDRKGYGLRSFKQVSGAYHADKLGTIESIWYYTDGEWIVLQSEWKEANPS